MRSRLTVFAPNALGKRAETVSATAKTNFRNASTLCFVGGPSMQSATLTLRDQSDLKSKDMVLVSSPTWLERSHSDWDSTYWGQSMRYLTPPMRKIAKELFPKYPEANQMTYGMMKDIIRTQRDLVRASGITLIEDHVDVIKQSDEGLSMKSSGKESTLAPHNDFYIINAARCERDTTAGLPEIVKARSYGEMYSMSKAEADSDEPLVIIGSGLNLTWAVRDFPHRPIIHLIPSGDIERPELLHSLHAAMKMEATEFMLFRDSQLRIMGIDLKTSKKTKITVSLPHIFSSMGFFLNKSLVNASRDQVTHIDAGAKQGNIRKHINMRGEKHDKALDMRGSHLPQGNLSLVYHQILMTMGDLTKHVGKRVDYPATDAFAAIFMEGWEKAVLQKSLSVGVHINPEFFSLLHDLLKHSVTHGIPREDQLWQVIRKTFTKGVSIKEHSDSTMPTAINKYGVPLTWNQFKKLIETPIVDEAEKATTLVRIESISHHDASKKS